MKQQNLILFGAIILICTGVVGQLWKDTPVTPKKQPQVNCMECHFSLTGQEVMHAPVEDACDYCHISNGNDHPMENVIGFDLGDQMPGLCYLCHEEPTKKNQHMPSEMGECLMCHSVHGSPNKFLLVQPQESVICAECHDMSMTEKPVKHSPVANGSCSSCHDPHQSDNSGLLRVEPPDLCLQCHESVKEESGLANQHYPFEEDCSYCHETHSSDQPGLLIEKSPELCYECHDMESTVESAKVIHKVINEKKGCANCHSPHASEQGMLLIEQENDLCLSCHSKTIKTVEKNILNIGQQLEKSTFIHYAIEMDGCTACHNPHVSENFSLLNGSFPEGLYSEAKAENFALCFTCHESEILTSEISSTATYFRNGDQNLHFVHINGDKGRNCNVCHEMHGSVNEHLIRESVWFGNWEMPIEYTSDENGGSCNTGCHAKKNYSRE